MPPAPAGTVASDPLADPGPAPHPSLVSPSSVPNADAASTDPSQSSTAPYEPPQPSGSLLLAWQTKKLSILLIGGGAVAASRLYHLLCAQPARIVVLAPRDGTCDEVSWRLTSDHPEAVAGRAGIAVEWRERALEDQSIDEEIEGFDMVLTALDDAPLSRAVYTACKARRVLVNVADVPPECDFYFGSTLRRGALSVMVSTNGKGPRVAARLRRRLEKALPDNAGRAIDNVGLLRAGLRKRENGGDKETIERKRENGGDKETIERRMEWMIRVSDRWSLAQLGEMDDRMRDAVLEGWERGEAKGYWDVNRSKCCGLGWVASLFARAGVGRCPVDRDPDGTALKCPFVMTSTGFLLGLATAGTAAAIWARR